MERLSSLSSQPFVGSMACTPVLPSPEDGQATEDSVAVASCENGARGNRRSLSTADLISRGEPNDGGAKNLQGLNQISMASCSGTVSSSVPGGAGLIAGSAVMSSTAASTQIAPSAIPLKPGQGRSFTPVAAPFSAVAGAGERVITYTPASPGKFSTSRMQHIYEPSKLFETRDSCGGLWRLYNTLTTVPSLCVAAPDGSVPLRLDMSGSFNGYMNKVDIDPDRKRLYMLYTRTNASREPITTLAAYDISTGREKAALENSGLPLAGFSIGESGMIYACGEGSVHVMDPDLQEIRSVPVDNLIPAGARELPGGNLLVSGGTFREGSQVYQGYGLRHAVIGPDGRTRLFISESPSAPIVHGMELELVDSSTGEAVHLDLSTGETTRSKAPYEAKQCVRRPDGALISICGNGRSSVEVTSASGRTLDKVGLGDWTAEAMVYSEAQHELISTGEYGGEHALFRIDVSAGKTALGSLARGYLRDSRKSSAAQPLYRCRETFIPVPLCDGRIAAVKSSGIDLLGPDGSVLSTYADAAAAKKALGPVCPCIPMRGWNLEPGRDPLAMAEAQLHSGWNNCLKEIRQSLPDVPIASVEALIPKLDDKEELRRGIWGQSLAMLPFSGSVSATYPGGTEVSVSSGSITFRKGSRGVCSLEGSKNRRFTAALPFEEKGRPCMAVATTDSTLLVFRADYEYGPKVAREYPLPHPLKSLAPVGDHIVALGAGGDLLEIVISDEPGAVSFFAPGVAGGETGSGACDGTSGAGERVYREDDQVVIDNIRLPINSGPALGSFGYI
jgi:hypothetical protein